MNKLLFRSLLFVFTASLCSPLLAKDDLPEPVPLGQLPDGPATLSNMTDRWDGMTVRTRVPLKVPKKADKHGWARGSWVSRKGDKTKMRVWVHNRAALNEIIPRKEMLVGVTMSGSTWSAADAKRGKGVYVDFKLANYDGLVRLEFEHHVDQLPEIERYLRNFVLDVRGRTATPRRAATPAPAPRAQQPIATPSPRTTSVAAATAGGALPLDLMAVECEPPSVAAGGSMGMVASYRVTSSGEVVEKRRILDASGKQMAAFDEAVFRDPGVYTSSQPLNVPDGTPAGRYTLEITIESDGAVFAKSAPFQVR